jgi:cell division septum initiation protein DivIVA
VTKVDGEKLLRENAELRALVTRLTEQIAKLTERVAELLAVAQRRQRKPAPEMSPGPRPDVVGDAKKAFEAPAEASEEARSERTREEAGPPDGTQAAPSAPRVRGARASTRRVRRVRQHRARRRRRARRGEASRTS